MKKVYSSLLALLVLAAIPAQADAKSLKVSVKGEGNKVQISFVTVATHTSMCFMETRNLNVDLGKVSLTDREGDVTNGKITLRASTNPLRPCLMAFGPHRGSITLEQGRALPQLPNGSYKLVINGETYGTLELADQSAKLIE
jgi:hypothetical protein